jgi:hypothetical protein
MNDNTFFSFDAFGSNNRRKISILANYACDSTDKQRGENPSNANLDPPEKPQKL